MIQYEIWIWKKATKGQMGSSQKVRSSRRVSLVCLSSPNGCCRWDTSLQPGRRHTAAVTVAMNCCTTSCCWHRNVRNDRPMRMACEWLLPGKHHSAATNAEGHHLHFWSQMLEWPWVVSNREMVWAADKLFPEISQWKWCASSLSLGRSTLERVDSTRRHRGQWCTTSCRVSGSCLKMG